MYSMQQQLITPHQVIMQPAPLIVPITPISMQMNPTMQQMMQYNSQQHLNNYQQSTPEQKAHQINKGNQSMTIEREEQCMQLFWDFRTVTYKSHLGEHSLNRYQLNCLNLLFVFPLKICFCSYRIPNAVENQFEASNQPRLVIAGPSCGYLTIGEDVLGYYQLENPSLLCQCLCGETPIVHITNAVTQEKSILKTETSCVSSCLECCLPCFALSRNFVDEKGKTSTYSRSFCQAIFNCLTLNSKFYNQVNFNYNNSDSEMSKLLQYGAFIFFQEYSNNFKGCLIC
ncbi:hypothetical protein TTHERM_00028900 (macronuclear) [Tetrahymena thermophila SB210]|uniref:Phospholipid scramblase n=1 Tax=Tetrahymena thermophila (strain SB210) TaxID=312017 RepID=Q22MY4_TETTS|nr:hypothetical protein TTHERM_00028900 [Tetrahymena thermophila SB210]EAR86310.1 hypothetical protein TTHERM_00028900 [Tetrahymena thermophila SB210]|eukprot:XP_976886.1 hypothetical protein TTHERM_00028900 [Tetrahymena thermophila SB210]